MDPGAVLRDRRDTLEIRLLLQKSELVMSGFMDGAAWPTPTMHQEINMRTG